MALIPHIKSNENVTVFLDGRHIVPVNTPQYDLVVAAIEAGDAEAVKAAINIRQAVVNQSFGKITLDGKTLMYDGRPLHGALVNRILTIVKEAGDAGPLLAFLERLMKNPSYRAINETYGFMDACELPVTRDGYILAYKKVRYDYTDIHSGKFDNSVGQIVEVPRNSVDENQNNTCSYGLHFCSVSYLPNFGSNAGSSRVVVLKIDPADIVAIPTDYNNAKGRCCKYEVVGELEMKGSSVLKELAAGFESKYDAAPVSAKVVVAPVKAAAPVAAAPAPIANTPAIKLTTPAKAAPVAQGVAVPSLTDKQVREIRNLLADNWPLATIAKTVGTSARTVARIRDGETYTHVA